MSAAPEVLRVLPVPSSEPEPVGVDWGRRTGWRGAGSMTASQAGSGAVVGGYVQGSLAVDFRNSAEDRFFGPQATSTQDLPDAEGWARRMIQAVLEVYDGTRSPDQLVRWVVPDIRDRAHRRGQLARRRGRRALRPPHIRTVLTGFPADGVCEVAAVVHVDGRIRALAVRLCGVDGRWLITEWELG